MAGIWRARERQALLQLQAYGAAIGNRWGGRWIHWAVVERSDNPITEAQLRYVRDQAAGSSAAELNADESNAANLYIFSRAAEIEDVLRAAIEPSDLAVPVN